MVIGGGAGAGSGGGTGGDEAVLCIYISFHILHKICLLHIFTMPIYAFIYSYLPHYIRLPRAYPLICHLRIILNDITRKIIDY